MTDQLGRGYAGMTHSEVVTDMHTEYRPRNRDRMTGSEVLNAIDSAVNKDTWTWPSMHTEHAGDSQAHSQ